MDGEAAAEEPLRVFVGYDPREDIAWRVCRQSILARASRPVAVEPISAEALRQAGVHRRKADPKASTAFTYTRFLTPWLAGYRGWALYCDCDMLALSDIARLFALADGTKAAMVVQHDHRPDETVKMDGRVQSVYPRKNWSSLVLYNAGHPANRALTPELVERETGAFLHRFQWLDDELIGALPESWNWLEGWSRPGPGLPDIVHYTRGGPWFDLDRPIEHADLWLAEKAAMEEAD